jgi:hypothetical protein
MEQKRLIVTYERVDHLLAIASAKLSEQLDINGEEYLYVVPFSDYIKSQIHLNVTNRLYNRDSRLYKAAYDYLIGESTNAESLNPILEFFYSDMKDFLLHNKYNIRLELDINVEVPDTKKVSYNYGDIRTELLCTANENFSDFNDARLWLKKHHYAENVMQYVNSNTELFNKIDSYTAIAILSDNLGKKNIKWEVPNEN